MSKSGRLHPRFRIQIDTNAKGLCTRAQDCCLWPSADHLPFEFLNARHRREICETEEQWAIERERERLKQERTALKGAEAAANAAAMAVRGLDARLTRLEAEADEISKLTCQNVNCEETIREIALDLKIRAKVIALRRLAAETSQTFSRTRMASRSKSSAVILPSACYPSAQMRNAVAGCYPLNIRAMSSSVRIRVFWVSSN
jgi:hypothetical protein